MILWYTNYKYLTTTTIVCNTKHECEYYITMQKIHVNNN